MRRLATLGLSLAAISHSAAATCDLAAASKEAFSAQVQRRAHANEAFDGTADQLEALTGTTDWSDLDAIRNRLSAADRPTLDVLMSRRREFALERLHETNRLRDIMLISEMATIAEQLAQESARLPEDKESMEYKLTGLVAAARELLPVTFKDVASYELADTNCSFEAALVQAAHEATSEFNGLAQQLSGLKGLAATYGQPLDPKKMSAKDAASYEKMVPLARKAKSLATLSFDLTRLAKIEAASKLMFEAVRADQNEAPGDVEHVGSTWTRWSNEGRLSEEQKEAANIVQYLYKHFPASTVFASTNDAAQD